MHLNQVSLIGNLGQDPDVRTTQNGKKIVNLSIATSESWKDKNTGERKTKTQWHRVVIFSEGLGGVAEKYLLKGSKVYVSGCLETRKWEDRDGITRYATEVVLKGFDAKLIMLDKQDGNSGGSARQSRQSEPPPNTGDDLDDDIPF